MQKLFIFSLSLVLLACKKELAPANSTTDNSKPDQIQSKGVWPVVSGNYWVYNDSVFYNDGRLLVNFPADTLKTTDTVSYQGKIFYGKDQSFREQFYSQVDDSTVEQYSSLFKNSYVYFKQVSTNNTIVSSTQKDATLFINGVNTNYHIVTTLTGYTDLTLINGYNCIRNEFVETYSGNLTDKIILYIKPGVGLVRLVQYQMDQIPGKLYLSGTRNLVSYKLK